MHRPARAADRRVHRRGDGTALPGRRAGHDIVLGVGRHTGRARDGHVPRLATGVGPVLGCAVRRLRAHMVHARVPRLAAGGRGQATPPASDDRRGRRPSREPATAAGSGRAVAAAAGRRQADGAPVLRQAVVPGTAGRAVHVLFRPTVLGRQRGGLLLGDAAQAGRTRPQRVPLHHGAGRHPAGRFRAGVWPDQAVRPPAAGRRVGRGHVRLSAVPGRLGARPRRPSHRYRGRPSDPGPGGHRKPDARPVHCRVHGVRQHRSGTVALDHVRRGEHGFFV